MQIMSGFLGRYGRKRQRIRQDSQTENRLFVLPREIRDEIYRQVLCQRYVIHWPARWKQGKAVVNDDRLLSWFRNTPILWRGLFWSGHVGMIKKPLFWNDIALLLTSKAISQEAIDIMYAESLFCVHVGRRSEHIFPMKPLPGKRLLDRMQNIEMEASVCNALDYAISEKWIKSFNGSHIKRNTCRISFPCSYNLRWCHDPTPFFRACQSLVGFKTVIVTLECICAGIDPEEGLHKIYRLMKEDFKAALEPHLGPSHSPDDKHVFSLEFHPRKHLEGVQVALSTSGRPVLVQEDTTGSLTAKRSKGSI